MGAVIACIPHRRGLDLLGAVPPGVQVTVWDGRGDPPPDAAEAEFWVPPFLADRQVVALAGRLPRLRVVQLMTAGVDAWLGKLPEGVVLCDGRGVHSSSTAEWAAAATLAAVREFPRFARAQLERRWDHGPTGELAGKQVLIVGAGAIGEALRARLAPFGVDVVMVARRARPGTHAIVELPSLLPAADVVVLLVPLTTQTRGMVDAAFLAAMSDGALLVNAARGPVVVTEALVAELRAGRLRAALDVTDPEPLPPDHPLWTAPGLLLTPHVAGSVAGLLPRAYGLVGDQLRRYAAGAPLDNVVTGDY